MELIFSFHVLHEFQGPDSGLQASATAWYLLSRLPGPQISPKRLECTEARTISALSNTLYQHPTQGFCGTGALPVLAIHPTKVFCGPAIVSNAPNPGLLWHRNPATISNAANTGFPWTPATVRNAFVCICFILHTEQIGLQRGKLDLST